MTLSFKRHRELPKQMLTQLGALDTKAWLSKVDPTLSEKQLHAVKQAFSSPKLSIGAVYTGTMPSKETVSVSTLILQKPKRISVFYSLWNEKKQCFDPDDRFLFVLQDSSGRYFFFQKEVSLFTKNRKYRLTMPKGIYLFYVIPQSRRQQFLTYKLSVTLQDPKEKRASYLLPSQLTVIKRTFSGVKVLLSELSTIHALLGITNLLNQQVLALYFDVTEFSIQTTLCIENTISFPIDLMLSDIDQMILRQLLEDPKE